MLVDAALAGVAVLFTVFLFASSVPGTQVLVGLALTGVSLLLFVYIAVGWFTGSAVQGWTSTMLVTVFLGAVQMFVLGMIGEYLGRLYIESKRRPLYLVADIAGPVQGTASIGFVADQPSAGTASVTSDTPGVIGTLPTR